MSPSCVTTDSCSPQAQTWHASWEYSPFQVLHVFFVLSLLITIVRGSSEARCSVGASYYMVLSHVISYCVHHHAKAPSRTLLSSMHRIRAVARQMLNQKLVEADLKDAKSKRDIMSLLIR